MIPIFVLSVLAIYLFVERYLYIKKSSRLDKNFLADIKERLIKGDINEALAYCRRSNFPVARMIERGLIRVGSSIRDIESAIEYAARVEVSRMEKNVNVLSAIAAIAPMFGFLGTVIGMMVTFYSIAQSDDISISVIADGIYVKMVSSAAGLIVGVMAYILYTTINSMIDRAISTMEETAMEFLDILHNPVG